MRVILALAVVCFAVVCFAQSPEPVAKPVAPSGPLSGRWTVTADVNGTSLYFNLELSQQGDKLTGNLDGDKLEGSVSGSTIQFQSKDDHGGTGDARATLKDGVLSGSFVFTDGDDPSHKESHTFSATRVPTRKA